MTEQEIEQLLLALFHGMPEGVTEEDGVRLVRWAGDSEMNHALLGNILKGLIDVRWSGDDWEYSLTGKGKETVATNQGRMN